MNLNLDLLYALAGLVIPTLVLALVLGLIYFIITYVINPGPVGPMWMYQKKEP